MAKRTNARRTIGIDTGGTFTDLVLVEGDDVRVAKVPSTPDDPTRAIVNGLALLLGAGEERNAAPPTTERDHIVHGTTVALNALLTRTTAKVALVTNEGFRDLIEIGRQDRPDIYALHPVKPIALVPRARRFEIAQRTAPEGSGHVGRFVEEKKPTRADERELARRVKKSGADSIAVCLLHSWAAPEIEERVGAALAGLGLPVTLSAGVHAEHREFERFSTALVNAALIPLMRSYLETLAARVGAARLSVLQSTGGTLSAERAAREPVRVILSGPAGGVVGAARAAREAGFDAFCGLDMGGTSTDVAFHAGTEATIPTRALEPVHVAGHPIAVPSLDIHTIGCGGGSLVTIDDGGVLHVGPESAGADPGPVCYGRSERPTVTDAHVLLGHIDEGPFVGGALALDKLAVRAAFERVGRALGVDAIDAARGVLDVARAAMRRAIGVMTMQRGQDPEAIPLIAFGGAGGLHAAALAGSLRMPAALVPLHPGALSARGMGAAEAIRDHARTILAPLASWNQARRRKVHTDLARLGRESLKEAGFAARAISLEHGMDLRYRGQSYEIHVAECADAERAFHAAHAALYGYALDDREVELVCLRTRARVPAPVQPAQRIRKRRLPNTCIVGERRALFERGGRARDIATPIIDRTRLRAGHTFDGPALIEEYSGTTIVPPGWRATVTAGEHLRMTR